jgi:hypothetical protein
VYLLAEEAGINAFAAGYVPDDAVIGVTQGCLEQLTREELQGVIAHEFSHILNGDMRLNLKLIGVLQGLLFIYILGRMCFNSSSRSRYSRRGSGGGKFVLIGLSMVVIGGIGLIFGRLIKSGVSRQREYLADASAVQFTRNPNGLAGALRRIGGFTQGSTIQTPRAEEASHLFFGEAINANFMDSWFATHPPLKDRIHRLTGVTISQAPPTPAPANTGGHAPMMGLQGNTVAPQPVSPEPTGSPAPQPADPAQAFLASVGTTNPQQLAKAHAFLKSLPTPLAEGLRSPAEAMAIVCSFLIDGQPEVRSRQLALFDEPQSLVQRHSVETMTQALATLDIRQYLPLLDLTIPALRTITPQQCAHFFKQIQGLVRADGHLSLSEYVLQLILQKRLRPHFQKPSKPPQAVTQLEPLWHDCEIVLTVLARAGHKQSAAAVYAFKAGVARLPGAHQRQLPQTLPVVKLYDLGQSLQRLEPAVPKLKQAIVDAAAHTVLVDQEVTPAEAELLRAIVISLDCPIPPFLEVVPKPARPRSVSHSR